MKALLDQHGHDRRPHKVAPDCWYYEEPGGLAVYFEGKGMVGLIPWRSIRASLERYDARHTRKRKITS